MPSEHGSSKAAAVWWFLLFLVVFCWYRDAAAQTGTATCCSATCTARASHSGRVSASSVLRMAEVCALRASCRPNEQTITF
ncbi:hypothetical protein PF010_g10388 [Phytophthora fragariae]|uniref:Secreted protein n=2 Tax=Phytophthora TaxID=4783 RepID=A0A6G0L9I3_9STRA|nr:hypothetical protein PR002_g9527 [Phytophthora rubi]KAE9035414.1 hypothetical protein PR001_g9312 [Phytophthora rubi]KAE9112644.1 hypothetical protein PF010_g10388 [Phytophthora fragariae]KAE9232730.1 hypothetical protein PF004_g9839 [Phytophthora fragariae]KAE9341782.1 hypothetical protein PR003_g9796 [Phytophthora rubi]